MIFVCQKIKLNFVEMKNEINCLDFSEDGSMFATSGKDLALRIYDTKTCKVKLYALCFSIRSRLSFLVLTGLV